MSKVNDIKSMKRKQKTITPTQALAATVGEEEQTNNFSSLEETKISSNQENNISSLEEKNVSSKQEKKKGRKEENKIERKRVSFDLRTDLHKELKLQALIQEKNIYSLIEEALDKYLKVTK